MPKLLLGAGLLALLVMHVDAPPARAGDTPEATAPLRLGRTFALPDVDRASGRGRFDHFAYDPLTKRLFVTAVTNGSVEVVDLESGKAVGSVGGLSHPLGIVLDEARGRVLVTCGGDGTLKAIDTRSLEVTTSVAVGRGPDNVRLVGGKVVVANASGFAVLGAATLERTASWSLPGAPESFQAAPDGSRWFANVPDAPRDGEGGSVLVVDGATGATTATWHLAAASNYPMAIDEAGTRLYIATRCPTRLLAVDTTSGRTVASSACVGDADDVFVDPATGHVLLIGGAGAVELYAPDASGALTRVSALATERGARTGLLVPSRRALYVAVPRRGDTAAEIREVLLR